MCCKKTLLDFANEIQHLRKLDELVILQRDTRDNLDTSLCCIDALPRASRRQYDSSLVLREVNKAVIGFLPVHTKHSAMRDRRKGRPEPTRGTNRSGQHPEHTAKQIRTTQDLQKNKSVRKEFCVNVSRNCEEVTTRSCFLIM